MVDDIRMLLLNNKFKRPQMHYHELLESISCR